MPTSGLLNDIAKVSGPVVHLISGGQTFRRRWAWNGCIKQQMAFTITINGKRKTAFYLEKYATVT